MAQVINVGICAVCGKPAQLFDTECPEKPETKNPSDLMAIYDCPECGIILFNGIPHPMVCKECLEECFEEV